VLYGETLSTALEAVGMARGMALTGCPYAIGPVLDQHGHLPDGTPLETVIDTIDRAVTPRPVHYFINCTHPTVALAGLDAASARGGDISRVIGIKANGSTEAPTDLDGAQSVHSDPPNDWAGSMVELELRDRFGLRVLGGCCGTDGRHILALAIRLTTSGQPDHG
jgi:S-methylmethionine-dependent homocysteine/selenocysteine methylase